MLLKKGLNLSIFNSMSALSLPQSHFYLDKEVLTTPSHPTFLLKLVVMWT